MKAFRDLLNSASADELLDLLRAHRRFTYDYEDFLMKFLCIDTVAQAIQNIARPSDSGESPVKTEVHVRQGATRDIDPHHALYKNAIAFLENLIATNPEDWEKRATALNILGVFIADRYTSTHDPSDLLLAIAVRQNAIERTPVDTQELSLAEYNLGLLHHRLYACTRTRAYLESAWAFTSRALELADLAPGDRATVELLKARLLIERYREEQQNEALVLARTTLESALERLPAESLGRINLLDTLAEAAAWQHNASANTEPLDCAIERIRQSASLSEPDSPELPDRLLFLSNMLYEKYSVTGSTQELEASLSAIISALELQATFLQPSYIKGIAQFSIDDLYAFDGSLAELQRQYGARIRHLICRPQTTRNDLAENFATCAARCTELYRLTSNLPAQETAVWALQCATHYCTEGAILHTKYLGQLAGALRLSFHASGKRKYLHASVEAIERAIKNLGTESDLLVDLAWDLGTIQNELYTLTNKQDHLDSSIIAFSTAVLHCPETRPDCYLLNFNFGTALLTRHQLRRSRRVQPLGGVFKAIARKTAQIAGIFATLCGGAASSGKSGAASTQKSHEDRPSTSDSPAGVSEDLVRCLPSLQFALEHAPSDDSRLPLIRTQLAAACFEEYQITMKPQYLLRSIEVLGSAMETADPNSKERDIITGNLASSLHAARMLLDAHHSSCKTAP